LFCSCDLDLDPITLIYEHDGTILKRYRQTKELSRPKLEHYKQTIHRQSQMRPKAFTMPHSRVVTTAATCAQPDLARLGFDHRTIRCRACRCPMLLCIKTASAKDFRHEHGEKRYLFHVSSHRWTCDRRRALSADGCLSASLARRLIDPPRTCFHPCRLPAPPRRVYASLAVVSTSSAASKVTRCTPQVVIQQRFITFFSGPGSQSPGHGGVPCHHPCEITRQRAVIISRICFAAAAHKSPPEN